MVRVKVYLPFSATVEYTVEVEDPNNLEEIKEKLLQKDATDWSNCPDFYEVLGSNFRDFVKKISKEDVFLEE